MSTSNNQDDDSFIDSTFFPDTNSSAARDQNFRLRSLESAVTGLSSQMRTTILAPLLQQQTPVSPRVQPPMSPDLADRRASSTQVYTSRDFADPTQVPLTGTSILISQRSDATPLI